MSRAFKQRSFEKSPWPALHQRCLTSDGGNVGVADGLFFPHPARRSFGSCRGQSSENGHLIGSGSRPPDEGGEQHGQHDPSWAKQSPAGVEQSRKLIHTGERAIEASRASGSNALRRSEREQDRKRSPEARCELFGELL